MSHNGLRQTDSTESIDSDQKSDSIEKKRVHPDIPLDDEPDYVATENYSYNKKQSKFAIEGKFSANVVGKMAM